MITIQNSFRVVWLDTKKLDSWHLSVQEDRAVITTKVYQEPEAGWNLLFDRSIKLSENQKTWLATALSNNLVLSLTEDIQVDFKELLKECQQKS